MATYDRGPLEPEHYGDDKPWIRKTAYVVVALIFTGLAITALFTFRTVRESREASTKADTLISSFTSAGLPAPPKEQVTKVLGDDGGVLCADPDAFLNQAMIRVNMANGAAGPGQRPVIVPQNVVEGQRIAIEVYCPEHLDEFDEFVNSNKYADTVKS
jgi:hypothetical protein